MYQDRIVLTSRDILEKEFKIDTRGYRPQEVDRFLDMIIKDYEEMNSIIKDLEREKKQLKNVEERITEAANKGEVYCYVWDDLMPNVAYYLRQQGYIVKTRMERNETNTIISWSDAEC